MGVAVGVCVFAVILLSSFGVISQLEAMLFLAIVPSTVILYIVRRQTRCLHSHLADALLEVGLCPACGYTLHGLPTADDSCLVCSECGRAWKRARIDRFLSEDAEESVQESSLVRRIFGLYALVPYDAEDGHGVRRPIVTNRELAAILKGGGETRDTLARERIHRKLRALGLVRRIVFAVLLATMYGIGFASTSLGSVTKFSAMTPSIDAFWAMGFSLLGFLVLGIMFVGVPLWVLFSGIGRPADQAKILLLDEGLCATCARSLSGLSAEADGCTVCPECGAAWRIEANRAEPLA